MKNNDMRKTAQVIALSENSEKEDTNEVESMKNKNISIDGYRKIHRAQNVSLTAPAYPPRN